MGSCVAEVVMLACICSSNFIPSPGTSIFYRYGPKKKRKRKKYSNPFKSLILSSSMYKKVSESLFLHFPSLFITKYSFICKRKVLFFLRKWIIF